MNFMAIKEICERINEELRRFNKGLGQVCHKLTPIFIGRVRLFSIYMIWKYQAEKI